MAKYGKEVIKQDWYSIISTKSLNYVSTRLDLNFAQSKMPKITFLTMHIWIKLTGCCYSFYMKSYKGYKSNLLI